MRPVNADNGGRRFFGDRRRYSYLLHIPERRSTRDRRTGFDRRQGSGKKRSNGRERRAVFKNSGRKGL